MPLRFLLFSLSVLCGLLGLPTELLADDAAPRPNIVLILSDDLGQGDLGCYNEDSKIPTPHMDAVATAGIRFTDAHTPSSVCTPTRYGLLTGRYCWRTSLKSGVLWGYSPLLIKPGRVTLASQLGSVGYRTGIVGKWHLGLGTERRTDYTAETITPGPNEVGFNFSYIIPASLDMDPYLWLENGVPVERPTEKTANSKRVWDGGKGYWRGGPIAPSFRHDQVLPTIAEQSIKFIEREATSQKPFFLYVPFASPHTPWVPTEEYVGKTTAGAYGDFTHQTDAMIGKILAALKQTGAADNTLVIITSDNGSHWRPQDIEQFDHEANNGVRGMKADIWEGGHRVPLLMAWPGQIPAGGVREATVCLTDLFATLCDVLEVPVPEGAAEDSFSLAPLFPQPNERETTFERGPVIHHSLQGTFAIREGDWKLIVGNLGSGGFTAPRKVLPKSGDPGGQLYNLADDPLETKNLWNSEPEVVKELSAELTRIRGND